MRTEKSNDIGWIVGGAVAIIIAGIAAMTILSVSLPDATAPVGAITTLITAAIAGLFGLREMNKMQQQRDKAALQETKEQVAEVTQTLNTRLNGELDRRMQQAVAVGIAQFRAQFLMEVKQVMAEVLDEWTAPPRK